MKRFRVTYCVLRNFLLLLLVACGKSQPTVTPLSSESSLFVFDFSASSLIKYDSNFAIARKIPISLPCPLIAAHAAPRGYFLALELECVNGSLVQIVDVNTGKAQTPFDDVDSHFLAWDFEGAAYLRVDAFGNARLARVIPNDDSKQFNLPAQTYDLDFSPDASALAYSFTRGLGTGSELWAATSSANRTWQLHADARAIIAFARWSPDGKRIAFIKFPDTAAPFPMGELWLMDSDGGNARPLAPADAGHGYAPAWSPDSTRIAFVGRENPDDPRADQSAGALVSNVYIVEISGGTVARLTNFAGSVVEAPAWSADGNTLAFSVIALNDTIEIWVADLASGAVTLLESRGPACCPAWIRK